MCECGESEGDRNRERERERDREDEREREREREREQDRDSEREIRLNVREQVVEQTDGTLNPLYTSEALLWHTLCIYLSSFMFPSPLSAFPDLLSFSSSSLLCMFED
jgi:hypothetical protein